MNKKEVYEKPSFEVLSVKVEKGFAGSLQNGYSNDGEAGMLNEGETYNF